MRFTLSSLFILALFLSSPGATCGNEENPPAGPILYARHCASCHRPLDRTLLSGRSASRIRSAIIHFAVMSGLKHLEDGELEAISAALAAPVIPGSEAEPASRH